MHPMDADLMQEEKAWRQLHKNATSHIERILEAVSHKTVAVKSRNSHL